MTDIDATVAAFMTNERPMPECPLVLAVEITALEIGHRNLMADFERSFARVFGPPAEEAA